MRALTRDTGSEAAKALARQGAEVVRADLTVPSDVTIALQGCWGVFGVTNFYDPVSILRRGSCGGIPNSGCVLCRKSKTTLAVKNSKERTW